MKLARAFFRNWGEVELIHTNHYKALLKINPEYDKSIILHPQGENLFETLFHADI
jgi:hypothetical protein